MKAKNITCIASSCDNKKLILIDNGKKKLKFIDFYGNFKQSIKLKRPFCEASACCINKDDEVFIVDLKANTIFFIEKNDCRILTQFKKKFLSKPVFMAVDTLSNGKIYVSSRIKNQIYVFDSLTGLSLSQIPVESPKNIAFCDEKLMVLSSEIDVNENKKAKTLSISSDFTEKSNCILIINKTTHKLLQKIPLNNTCNLSGLYFDNKCNFITTGYDLRSSKIQSKSRFLYAFDQNGVILKKFYMEEISEFNDLIIYHNKLIFLLDRNNISFLDYTY